MPQAKVLCLGDSLTRGADEADAASYRTYRGALQVLLQSAGVQFDFVGPLQSAPLSGGSDPDVAAWGGACIDATGNGSNNLTDRLAALKASFPSLDLLIVYAGWNDVYQAPANIASRYATFINAVQSGAWSSVKAILCTLHPQRGETEAQTAAAYSAYGSLNAQIRSMASSSRIVADLAARTGADASAWVEGMIYDAQHAPDFSTIASGDAVPSALGGHLITSYKSIVDFTANWSPNPPAAYNAPGGMGLAGPQSAGPGHPRFVNNVAGVTPWFWCWALEGDASSNTCIEVRNMYAGAKRAGGGWEFFFSGARTGSSNDANLWVRSGSQSPQVQMGHRPDGITSYYKPHSNTGIEVWPVDTIPSRGIAHFFGGFNRDLMANAECFIFGAQVRLALIDPAGVNDIASARFGVGCGADFFTPLGGRHYDWLGWPYNAMDGGHDRWKRLTATDWVPVTSVTIGSGADGHWQDPGTAPPLANWYPPTPYNDIAAGYSLSAAQVRASPPPLPAYWSGGGAGYSSADYWDVIHLYQSGADKVAQTISGAIIGSGVLSAFTVTSGGGSGDGDPVIPPEVLPGLATAPNWVDRLTGGDLTWTFKNHSPGDDGQVATAPAWPAVVLPVAIIGAAFAANLTAAGTPAPTYSIVSGAPAWLTLNEPTGVLGGTPSGNPTSHTVTFRASNASGHADITLSLRVVRQLQITTTSLPNAIQNEVYSGPILATGVEPFVWALESGSLPAGLTFSAGVVSGTATSASGTSNFTVRATDAVGQTATRAFSITVGTAGQRPVITTTTLPSGAVGTAWSGSVVASGSGVTWKVVSGALPPGLSLNESTGAIAGTPTARGSYGFTVRASNAYGDSEAHLSILVQQTASVQSASPWARFQTVQ